MCEDRECVDEVKLPIFEGKRWPRGVPFELRESQMPLAPTNKPRIVIASVETDPLIATEVTKNAPAPAAKIEHGRKAFEVPSVSLESLSQSPGGKGAGPEKP